MSFNLTLATTQFVVCVTDRRLSKPTGGIVSERSNKLTAFQCADAHGFITYNGIGRDPNGKTPSDWLADIKGLASQPLDRLAAALKEDADKRLRDLSARGIEVRHTFVIAGFAGFDPFVMLISNSAADFDRSVSRVDAVVRLAFGAFLRVRLDADLREQTLRRGRGPIHAACVVMYRSTDNLREPSC